jgi:uncharacterized membrane protein YtjA (UPF0391 family)
MGSTTLAPAVATLSPVPLQPFSGEFLELGVLFLVLALVAAVLGARGIAGVSMAIARVFIAVFLVLAIVSLLL